jgi:hypothetical protein
VLHTLVLAAVLSAPPAPAVVPLRPATPASQAAPSQAAPAPLPAPSPPSASPSEPQDIYPIAEAPAEWAPALRKAEGAARDFQQALRARLGAAMAQGGPPTAIEVCAEEAQKIGAATASAAGVKLGRTSDRLRNPANAAPAWAKVFVQVPAGEKAADVNGIAVDLGNQLGVLLPIGVTSGCLGCHGPPASLSPQVTGILARRYPRDRAVGYADGDFRGWVWVEVRK